MPTNASSVGPLDIPIPEVGGYVGFADPVAVGFADYFAFWIRYGINEKFRDSTTSIEYVLPEANVFPYDPTENWVRNDIPALYVWWSGESRRVERTITQAMRVRNFRIFYVAKEVKRPKGARVFSGMAAAVDAIMFQACEQGFHYDYGYNGATPGTPIQTSLKLRGWVYERGKEDFVQKIPNVAAAAGGQAGGHVISGFPVFMGTMSVSEDISTSEGLTSADQSTEIAFNARINDPADTREPVTVLERYLISPSEASDSGE
jgi:hypothetical protein